jgi:hypothetical protein
VALDRYFKRLTRHPVIRKDAMFRSFIQEKDVAKTLRPMVTLKGAMAGMKAKMAVFRSKITVTERDPWFQVHLLCQSKQSRPQLRCGTRLERCERALHPIE